MWKGYYFRYSVGFSGSSSFNISKCKCGSSAISKTPVFPTVPIDCPFSTFSPSTTNSEVNKLQDDDYVARYAREKYMYSLPDEVIIRIPE